MLYLLLLIILLSFSLYFFVCFRTKSVLTVNPVEFEDNGKYSCVAKSQNGQHQRTYKVAVAQKTKMTTTMRTSTTTTTTATAASTTTTPKAGLEFPEEKAPCPISGYCLNQGQCNFIPWLGEMSCDCAPGFQGARCERKTTSALYSSSLKMANTLCLFGIGNPYHSC